MLHTFPRLLRPGAGLTVLLLASLTATACGDIRDETPTAPDVQEEAAERPSFGDLAGSQDLSAARAAAREHTPALLSIPGVVGTAVGFDAENRPAVKIFLAHGQVREVPEALGNVPVTTVVTGQFWARADETSRARPAPIGFSIGHPDVTAGTLGARVKDASGNVFILSNNHVIANSNNANIGDPTLQPGAADGGVDPDDVIGTLADFQVIDFGGGDNLMDAAVSAVDGSDVRGATPDDEGYGAPGTTVANATLNLGVQKYGRTTGHTLGEVTEIDVTVSVCYAGFIFCTASATFVDQIGISPGSFSDGGDSGSLIVTQDGNAPVGLLFAGSDTRTLANPIGPVLDRFNVSIDPTVPGDGDGEDPNSSPTADFTATCSGLTCDFDASGSSDTDGTIASYAWDFGDNTDGSGVTTSHTYGANGTYTVVLTVTDDDGASDTAEQDVTVEADGGGGDTFPTIGTFTVNERATGPWTRADVSWSVSDADGDLASVTTELLDGSGVLDSITTSVSGSSASGEHGLRTRGTPTDVRLTVTDAAGNTTVETKPVGS